VKLEFYVDDAGEHRWRVKAANGETTADSAEGYVAAADALQGAALTLGDLTRFHIVYLDHS
jgi:uncharacterized protein YegP (UPF0339 family)